MRRTFAATVGLALLATTACRLDARDDYLGDKDPKRFSLGHAATPAELASVNVDVSPNGAGLPPGSGTVEQGATVYAANCASCHGENGEGKPPYPQLIGGPKGNVDFSTDPKIPRTIGNYWPYATTLFDYVRRAMPWDRPKSLSDEEVYAVAAYVLFLNGVVGQDDVLDAQSLPKVKMPNRDGFIPFPRSPPR